MIRINKAAQLLAVSAIVAVSAFGSYTQLSNTGTSGAGCIGTVTLSPGCTLVAAGTVGDARYSLTSVPTLSQTTVTVQDSSGRNDVAWLGPNSTSRWLSPTSQFAGDRPGTYVYQQTFNLAATQSYYRFDGRLASDNVATIRLNGTVISTLGASTMGSWTPFTFTNTSNVFLVGLNTLQFTVTNTNSSTGTLTPSGLRVEFSNVWAPEGPTIPVLAMLLGGVIMFGFKRRKANILAQSYNHLE
jgi:hypothetical protein